MAEILLPTKAVQDGIKTKVDTIETDVKTLLTKGNSVVKSIQRGEVKGNNSSKGVTVNYTEINPNKVIVLIHGTISAQGDTVYVETVNTTSMVVTPCRNTVSWGSMPVSWQVIEFY